MMTPEDGHIQDGVLEVDENQISPFALFSHENGYRATVKSLKQNWKRKLNRLNYLFFKSWMKGLSWSLEQEGSVFEGRGGWWVCIKTFSSLMILPAAFYFLSSSPRLWRSRKPLGESLKGWTRSQHRRD